MVGREPENIFLFFRNRIAIVVIMRSNQLTKQMKGKQTNQREVRHKQNLSMPIRKERPVFHGFHSNLFSILFEKLGSKY